MERKAQGEIITTVLIILLVLAAIVIVWQAVRTTTERASTTVQTQAGCIGLDLSVTASCDTSDNSLDVQVTRGGDSLDSLGTVKLRVSAAGGTGSGTAADANSIALGSASFTKASFTGLSQVGSSVTINTGLVITPTTGDVYSCKGSTVKITCSA